jgi:hypothetical protein
VTGHCTEQLGRTLIVHENTYWTVACAEEADVCTKCLLKILHVKESVSAFHFWFIKIMKADTTWLVVGFTHSPALTQTTLNSVKGCHSLLSLINLFCGMGLLFNDIM